MEELLKIKEKYKISDKEMFVLSKLESNKANEGFIEKTKTSTMQEVILKKYRLSFFEKQKFLKNLKFSTFHTNEEFIEKYKDSELSVELQNEGKKGLKKGMFILGMVVFTFLGLLILFNFGGGNNVLNKEAMYEYQESGVYAVIYLIPKSEYGNMGKNSVAGDCKIGFRIDGVNAEITNGRFVINKEKIVFDWEGVGPNEGIFKDNQIKVVGSEGTAIYKIKN